MNFQIILQTPAGPQGLSIGLMLLFLRHASLPIFLALVAAGIAHVWQGYSGFTDIRAIIIGCALFCVFMVLLHHAQFIWQTRQTGRKLSALFGLEDNLLRRIGDIEAGQANALVLEDLQQRIGTLEAMVKELNQPDPKAAIHAAVEQGEGNVVVLKTKASHSGKGSVGDFKASHRVYRPAIDELLAGENLSIKLQPIIHLMSKEVVAVEAFAFLETRNGQQAVAEIVSSMSDEQLCLTDRIILKRLGGIARNMESDGHLLPIHYTFVSMKVARHPTW